MGKGCRWEHPGPKAPAVRKLWKEETTEAVLEFLGEVRAGCWQGARVRTPAEAVGRGAVSEGEEGGPGPP